MKTKLLTFCCLLISVLAGAQQKLIVYQDCSMNGVTIDYMQSASGSASVLSTSGRTSCEWVQLWEGGPKWATFNVGATITDYANLIVGADANCWYQYNADLAPYYNTSNVGGLYAWQQPNYNGHVTSWSDVTTGVADVATTLWGSNWKTPTKEQLDTLQNSSYDKTTWTWCDGSSTQYVTGCLLSGYKVSGVGVYADKSIFLPAVDEFSYNNRQVLGVGYDGRYWSNTPYNSERAYSLYFTSYRCTHDNDCRYGLSVRAVLVEDAPTAPAGVEMVDLGLPSGIKWANMNVGATSPEEYGDYFAWGETQGYTGNTSDGRSFDWASYKYCNGSYTTMTKYCTSSSLGTVDNKTTLEPEDDAAHVNWGGNWRMPTDAEWTELRTQCTWTTQNGVNGYRVTAMNGNAIFLPAAGYRNDTRLNTAGSFGNYWYSSLNMDYSSSAYSVEFNSSYVNRYINGRRCGLSVRPVAP